MCQINLDEEFEIECGEGWHDLLKPIFNYVDEYNKTHDEKIEILQIKEKFGGLRVYTNFKTDELLSLIKNAESQAYETCELCGSKENVGMKLGWYKTCCLECAKSISQNRNDDVMWRPNIKVDNVKYYQISANGEITPK